MYKKEQLKLRKFWKSYRKSIVKSIFCCCSIKQELRNFNIWWYWDWKTKFHYSKNPVWIDDADIDKILISKKVYFGIRKVINIFLVTKMMIIK